MSERCRWARPDRGLVSPAPRHRLMRVVVAGARGFIGRAIARAFPAPHKVVKLEVGDRVDDVHGHVDALVWAAGKREWCGGTNTAR